jgi:hypothetical protein
VKKLISERSALYGLLAILSLFVILHLMLLFRLLPYDLVWGGRAAGTVELTVLELIALFINLLMLGVVAVRAGIVRLPAGPIFLKIVFWIMFLFFLLNTVGNLVSDNRLEQLVFAPLTLLLALFCLRLAGTTADPNQSNYREN